jgi:shikimate dehydrogenase
MYQLGLIGYPLGHSRSPAIHTAALRAAGLVGEYRLYPIPTLPEGAIALEELISMLRIGELTGINITIPHKQSVMPLLDELSPTSEAIGAVNTILVREGRLLGENTDAQGFLADLRRLAPDMLPADQGMSAAASQEAARAFPLSALVLGAGGSARAVVYALWKAGFQVIIAARRLEEAQKIVRQYENLPALAPSTPVRRQLSAIPNDLSSLARLITHSESFITRPETRITFVVNTTPLGMHPAINASPWPEGLPFPAGAVVYDLVYNPNETLLVRQARQAGLCAFTALGMLVEQAALSFELWTGRPAPYEAMRQAAEQV